jgi:hypothetical protein
MRNVIRLTILAAAAALGFAPAALAQHDFDWTGQLAPGQRIEIVGVNGAIHATAARDGNIVVGAVKTAGRRGNAAEVRIESVAHAEGVTICAIYPSPAGQPANQCRACGGRNNTQGNDTSVDFTVQVPARIRLVAHTVNGSIDANGLMSDAEAATVNGSVTVATTGSARVTTVNGTIKAAMGVVPNGAKFTTVNGEVQLQLPAATNADVRVSTVSGDIRSDFPLRIDGEPGPKHASGVIGAGGQSLEITTVNGGVTLVRR